MRDDIVRMIIWMAVGVVGAIAVVTVMVIIV